MWEEPLPPSPRAGAGATEGGAGGSAAAKGARPAAGAIPPVPASGSSPAVPVTRTSLSSLFRAVAALLWKEAEGEGGLRPSCGPGIVRLVRGFVGARGAVTDAVGASLVCAELFGVWVAQHAEGCQGLAPFPHLTFGYVITALGWERQLLYLLWKSVHARESGKVEPGLALAFSALCRACRGVLSGVCSALSEEWHGLPIGRLVAGEVVHALEGKASEASMLREQDWAEGTTKGMPLADSAIVLLRCLACELKGLEWVSSSSDGAATEEASERRSVKYLVRLDEMAGVASESVLGRCIVEWETVRTGGNVLALLHAAQRAEPEVTLYTQNIFQGIMGTSAVSVPEGLSMEHCKGMLNLKSAIRQCVEKAGLGAQASGLDPEALDKHFSFPRTASLAEPSDLVPRAEPPEVVLQMWDAGVYEGRDALGALLRSPSWDLATDLGVALVESISEHSPEASSMCLDVMKHVAWLLRGEVEGGPAPADRVAVLPSLRKLAKASLRCLATISQGDQASAFKELALEPLFEPVRELLRGDTSLAAEAAQDIISISNRMVDSEHGQSVSDVYVVLLILPRQTVRKFLLDAALHPRQAPALLRAMTSMRPILKQESSSGGGGTLLEEELRNILELPSEELWVSKDGLVALVRLLLRPAAGNREGMPPLVSESSMLQHVLAPTLEQGRICLAVGLALGPLAEVLDSLERGARASWSTLAEIFRLLLKVRRARTFCACEPSLAAASFPFADLQSCVNRVSCLLCADVRSLGDRESSDALHTFAEGLKRCLTEENDWQGMLFCSTLFELYAGASSQGAASCLEPIKEVWAALSRSSRSKPNGIADAFFEVCGTHPGFAAAFEERCLRDAAESDSGRRGLAADFAERFLEHFQNLCRSELCESLEQCLLEYLPSLEREESVAVLCRGLPALLHAVQRGQERLACGPNALKALSRQLWAGADPALFRWVEVAMQLPPSAVNFSSAHLEAAEMLHRVALVVGSQAAPALLRAWGQYSRGLVSCTAGVPRVALASWLFRKSCALPLGGDSPVTACLLDLIGFVTDPGQDENEQISATAPNPFLPHLVRFATHLLKEDLAARREAGMEVVRTVLAQQLSAAAEEELEAPRVPAAPSSSSEAFAGEESCGRGEEPSGSQGSSGSLGLLLGEGRQQYSREELMQLRSSASSECPVDPDILAALARITVSST